MRKSLLLLLMFVGVPAIAWIGWRLAKPKPATPATTTASHADSSSRSADPSSPAGAEASAVAPASIASSPESAPEDGERVASREDAPKRTLRGRVRSRDALPADESIDVYALSRSVDAVTIPGRLRGDDHGKLVIARATADGAGAFELAIGEDVDKAFVAALGRYGASTETIEIDPRSTGELDVAVSVGAWLTGRVLLPEATAQELEGIDYVELEIDGDPFDELQAMNGFGGGGGGARNRVVFADGEMRFEFRALRPLREGKMYAAVEMKKDVAPAFALGKLEGIELAAGEHRDVAIDLGRGGAIDGVVVDESQAPVAGAEVTVRVDPRIWGLGGEKAGETKSAADGSFGLTAVRSGKDKLEVIAEGFLRASEDVHVIDGKATTVRVVLERGATISGRVTWSDGTPASGVEVEVDFDPNHMAGWNAFNATRGADGEATAAADGSFTIRGLGKGPFVVHAHAAPPGSAEKDVDRKLRWSARVANVAPNTSDVALVLAKPEGVQGRVLDEDGAPVAKFEVSAVRVLDNAMLRAAAEKIEDSFASEDGSFLLAGLSHGSWELFARAEGFGEPEPVPISIPRGGDSRVPYSNRDVWLGIDEVLLASTEPVELRIAHAATVLGEVLDAGGSPAIGATVSLHVGMENMIAFAGRTNRPSATTDEHGKFELAGLTAGKLDLVARSAASAASQPVALELAPKERREGVVLHLRQGGRITGEVFDAEGKPLRGARIMAQIPLAPLNQRWSTSAAEGRFEFPHLEPGQWQVIHMPSLLGSDSAPQGDDFGAMLGDMKMASADVVDGGETHVVLGAPPANPVKVRGRVTSNGRPVTGVLINMMSDGVKGLAGFKFTQVDSQGNFAVTLDKGGRHLITVQKVTDAGSQQSYEFGHKIPEQEEYELDIELPIASISGRVLTPDGEPAPNERVSLVPQGAVPNGTLIGGRYAEIRTDDRGEYALDWLEPGDYTVAAGGVFMGGLLGESSKFGRQVRDVRVAKDQALGGVDFRLERSGVVEGIVRDRSGAPIESAALFLRDSEGRLLERISSNETKADGRFRYSGLAPGNYQIEARASARATSESLGVTVREAETTGVEITLDAATMLIVALLDEKDAEVDARVLVVDEKGRQVNGLWSLTELMTVFSQGGFTANEQRIGPLPPGKYRVTATATDGRSVTKPVTLTGQAERNLKLKLKE